VYQATFLVLARKPGSVRGETLPQWLNGVVRRIAKKHRAANAKWYSRLLPGAKLDRDASISPLAAMIGQEDRKAIEEEINRLKEKDQLAIRLWLEEKSDPEIAAALGCSPEAAKQRYLRARHR